MNIRRLVLAFLVTSALAPMNTRAFAQSTTSRLALVIGEAQYRAGPLATAANDGGLLADLLRQAGFDVTGAANLSQDQIRQTFREFQEKVTAAGPAAEVFVYLSGKGFQFAGENYLAPVEATIGNSADAQAEAVRLSDFLLPLSNRPARGRVIVLDLARPNNFGRAGEPLASGLALVDAPDNTLLAFNAAPGTIAPDESGPYGAYAQALATMLRQPGLPLNDAFAQVRLRVNESTRGGQTPWHASKLTVSFALFEPAPGVARVSAPPPRARRPMRDMSPQEAYGYAVERDTFESYNDFVVAYPSDPLARRVRAMLAARREALTWRRTFVANSPDAYWTYLQRYPRGPHAPDARRRLAFLSAPLAPPPSFRVYDAYDVPPPPPEEIVIVDRPRFLINEVVDVPPPRLAPEYLLPVAAEYRELPPPPPPQRSGFLPIPIPIPIPFGRSDRPQGAVVAPGIFQAPAAQGGASPALPPGYSPPGFAGQARPTAAPAAAGAGAPTAPGQFLPQGAAPAGRPVGTPPTTANPAAAPATPVNPTAAPASAVNPDGVPTTTVSPSAAPNALPRPAGAPAGSRPGSVPAVTTAPDGTAPSAGRPSNALPTGGAPANALPTPAGIPAATGRPAGSGPTPAPVTGTKPTAVPATGSPAGAPSDAVAPRARPSDRPGTDRKPADTGRPTTSPGSALPTVPQTSPGARPTPPVGEKPPVPREGPAGSKPTPDAGRPAAPRREGGPSTSPRAPADPGAGLRPETRERPAPARTEPVKPPPSAVAPPRPVAPPVAVPNVPRAPAMAAPPPMAAPAAPRPPAAAAPPAPRPPAAAGPPGGGPKEPGKPGKPEHEKH